ncbi:hypothetical protein RFF05_06360 [Bengtsoniella intestinalis]|uniref:hypothetical protein n=1 Tax=Bengtsoniella intestinalis TaxID=3073143 RepID=UPI00391F31BB
MKTLLKLGLVAVVTALCLYLSIGAIQSHLRLATEQERSLADLLAQQQLQSQLAAASAIVEQESEAQNLVIEQAEVELKEPTIEPEPAVETDVEEVTPEDVETEVSPQTIRLTPPPSPTRRPWI